MSTLEYALRCAAANPAKTNAILCLRNLIEGDGVGVDRALNAIIATFPLGLNEIEELRATTHERYGEGGTWTREVAGKFAPAVAP